MWTICKHCGAIVADARTHSIWHAGIEPIRDDPDPSEEPTHADH